MKGKRSKRRGLKVKRDFFMRSKSGYRREKKPKKANKN